MPEFICSFFLSLSLLLKWHNQTQSQIFEVSIHTLSYNCCSRVPPLSSSSLPLPAFNSKVIDISCEGRRRNLGHIQELSTRAEKRNIFFIPLSFTFFFYPRSSLFLQKSSTESNLYVCQPNSNYIQTHIYCHVNIFILLLNQNTKYVSLSFIIYSKIKIINNK